MTHDQLLAKIDGLTYMLLPDEIPFEYKALRAVVELCDKWETRGSYHIPIEDIIQAIEKELL
jgi:hypothetical protein